MIIELDPFDLKCIFKLGREFYEEAKLPGKFSEKAFKKSWTQFINLGVGVIFAELEDDKVIGAISGLICPDPNSGDLMATEFFWFMTKGKRGSGMKLFKTFEDWARDKGAKRIMVSNFFSLMHKKFEKFFQRKGYRPLETHYIKEVT